MSTFELLAAVDLLAARVVRLRRGAFDSATTYDGDPAEVALRLVGAGARWLHVVDLDGARAGSPRQSAVVAAVVRAVQDVPTPPRVEAAGGIRTSRDAEELIAVGVDRIVLGTAAIEHPDLVAELVRTVGADRVAVAVDVRGSVAVGDAWIAGAPASPADEMVARLRDVGVELFEVTAIERDGSLEGPDLALLHRIAAATSARVIASGGIRSIADLAAVRETGCAGAIVGRAAYEGGLDLAIAADALAAAR
ncbi:MAG TPA: 1-(5-phosphoribosyl)-5-[(5-phosphoribosylamino)methylideneamino] imidazole-4-carboxamide isomerase [Candidatus Limnocylindrales bacterium]|nr:1-(5-phosphoribosyl)-5-[(5-phosphoribosylamino)methylideneamino] imidazole-4-carboxamide isomerase [Candidatus Limnocylindrales bacterium]